MHGIKLMCNKMPLKTIKNFSNFFKMQNHCYRCLSTNNNHTQKNIRDLNKDWKLQVNNFIDEICSNKNIEEKFIPVLSKKPTARDHTKIHFRDYVKMRVMAGNGGDGCVSLASEYLVEFAGPHGGDGGNGGHVIFKAVQGMKSLHHIPGHCQANSGTNGRTRDQTGKSADHKFVRVPVGTKFTHDGRKVAYLDKPDMMFIAARGGAGGKGNAFFADDIEQAPKIAERGGRGEEFDFEIELTTMADIGLLGFPNAGKSTLLRAISRARPKVASYPFTTLNPHVGIVHYADLHQMSVADIPGLIEDAHKNRGLGFSFLKHIERCSSLLYVIDLSADKPWEQFKILRSELDHYQEGLSSRPNIIVANKMDLPGAEKNFAELKRRVDLPVFPISAKMSQQISPLLSVLRYLMDFYDLHAYKNTVN